MKMWGDMGKGLQRVLFISILASSLLASGNEQSHDPFWLGIMRDDGVIAPIAVYRDASWTTPWPEDFGNTEISPTEIDEPNPPKVEVSRFDLIGQKTGLDKIPVSWLGGYKSMPDRWYLLGTTSKNEVIHTEAAVQYDTHCEYMWGLLASGGQSQSYRSWPRKKRGFVATSPVPTSSFAKVDEVSVEGQDIMKSVTATFESLEKSEIARIVESGHVRDGFLTYTGHPVSEAVRNATKPSVLSLSKARGEAQTDSILHISMSRRYTKPKGWVDYGCEAITFFEAVLSARASKFSMLSSKIVISDCDAKGADQSIPSVVLFMPGGPYLVSENYGYEWEYYSVHAVGKATLQKVVERSGGGC